MKRNSFRESNRDMRILDNMSKCYGCGACFNICPTEAICMEANSEGFLEPFIDEEKCISCGKCRKVCPAVNCEYSNEQTPDIFAFSAEEKILYDSSSGGMIWCSGQTCIRSCIFV